VARERGQHVTGMRKIRNAYKTSVGNFERKIIFSILKMEAAVSA
jgi:hypothetical protein